MIAVDLDITMHSAAAGVGVGGKKCGGAGGWKVNGTAGIKVMHP